MTQLEDKSLNYFAEFFATPALLVGVPVSYAPVPGLSYGAGEEGVRWISPTEGRRLAAGVEQAGERYLVLQPYHGPERLFPSPEPERLAVLRAVFRQIRPLPAIEEEIDRWWDSNLGGDFVVGVNVRTGNGHYFAQGMAYHGRVDISLFDDEARFLRVLTRACQARVGLLPRRSRGTFRVYFATDSGAMSQALSRLPGATTRRRTFPPSGTGDTYCAGPGDDRRAVVDTIADMFLLARCDALVYNNSNFNLFARARTANFSGNIVNFEKLFLRYWIRGVVALLRRS
jgi:hypothetical protein